MYIFKSMLMLPKSVILELVELDKKRGTIGNLLNVPHKVTHAVPDLIIRVAL